MEDRYLDDDREYGAICSRCGASVENWETDYVYDGKVHREVILCQSCYDELVEMRNEAEEDFYCKCQYI